MTLFPEGTRSRDGSVGPGRAGTGLLILATRAQVIPVAIDGMQEVLPVGCYVPRIFKRISVSYGPPVDYAEFLAMPRTRETAPALIDRVMEAMQVQHAELRSMNTELRRREKQSRHGALLGCGLEPRGRSRAPTTVPSAGAGFRS